MKYLLIILLFLGNAPYVEGQENQKAILAWQKRVGDVWFNKHVDSMLKKGDQMPDLPLEPIANNYTAANSFSDFKGKLIILDFWGTACSVCIEAWPKMEELQKEFGDRIQIILVNPWETQEQINKIFSRRKKAITIPGLPSITGIRSDLQELFPSRAVPIHVWINEQGKVIANGAHYNTHSEKISKMLEGKKMSFIKGLSSSPFYQPQIPYYLLQGQTIHPNQYNSFFYPYNPDISAETSGWASVTDSMAQTVRHTFVNFEIVEMLNTLFSDSIKPQYGNSNWLIWSPAQDLSKFKDFFRFQVRDTVRYTSSFIKHPTDKEYMKSRLCYEQVVPLTMPEEKRKALILNDLNTYLGERYGAKAYLEQQTLSCFVLIRTSKKDKLTTDKPFAPVEAFTEKGKKMKRVTGLSLPGVMETIISPVLNAEKNNGNDLPLYCINETGFPANQKVEIAWPEGLISIGEVRAVLKKYDLDIINARRTINIVVIREDAKSEK